ncbi:MAG: YkgJ family cysteine cluster protein [Syntrophobacteria bacterium]
MNVSHLFQHYERLAAGADHAFRKMQEDYAAQVICQPYCTDCCHAVFGLFLIEAVFLQQHFAELTREERSAALHRAEESEWHLKHLEKKIETYGDDVQMASYCLARERIRCPLLNEHQECILYPYRPITCRVYGIPTLIQGRAHVCAKTGFKSGEFYPTFNLDEVQKELYLLSRELLQAAGSEDLEKASLLISVSQAIKTPFDPQNFSSASEASSPTVFFSTSPSR